MFIAVIKTKLKTCQIRVGAWMLSIAILALCIAIRTLHIALRMHLQLVTHATWTENGRGQIATFNIT